MLSSISVTLPSLSEQLEIVTEVEKIEKEITNIKAKLATIDDDKKLILKKYLE